MQMALNLLQVGRPERYLSLRRKQKHTCGHPRDAQEPPPATTPLTCASLLPMFELLLSLGADPNAVDACRCHWLATAAAAGDHGLWNALAIDDRMSTINLGAVHASSVLLRAAQYSCSEADGQQSFFQKAAEFLQRLYAAHGSADTLQQQLARFAVDRVLDGDEGESLRPTHALLAAMQARRGEKVLLCLLTATFEFAA